MRMVNQRSNKNRSMQREGRRLSAARRTIAAALAGAMFVAAVVPATADGVRGYRRHSSYAIGEISRNVITPWYVGYYGSHYSYYPPDPMPPRRIIYVVPTCWAWTFGWRDWC
jgi:hypothetical protein